MNREKLYWILQLSGWGVFALIGALVWSSFNAASLTVILLQVINSSILLLFTHGLRTVFKQYKWTVLPLLKLLPRLLIINCMIGVVTQAIASVFLVLMGQFEWNEFSFPAYFVYVFNTNVLLWLWCLCYFSFHYVENYKQGEIEKWRLQAVAKDAELTALKSQINPHFMFNCLNNIRSLIVEDPLKAREMITRLSELMHYVIKYHSRTLVPLEQELEIVEHYLSLESIHFEERLSYSISIGPLTSTIEIPSMTIQMLVENAIKHGLAKNRAGGEITIKTYLQGGSFIVEVLNTGQLAATTEGQGIGLKNIKERLKMLIGEDAVLELKSLETNRVLAQITIPVQIENNKALVDENSNY